MPKVVAVLDGQGGGIGSAIIRALRERMGLAVEVWALGTNAIATSQMMRAGASKEASGETAVIHEVSKSQVVLGTISIILANSFMGEITAAMAAAVADSPALKLLLPLNQENIEVAGTIKQPLPHQVNALLAKLLEVQSDV